MGDFSGASKAVSGQMTNAASVAIARYRSVHHLGVSIDVRRIDSSASPAVVLREANAVAALPNLIGVLSTMSDASYAIVEPVLRTRHVPVLLATAHDTGAASNVLSVVDNESQEASVDASVLGSVVTSGQLSIVDDGVGFDHLLSNDVIGTLFGTPNESFSSISIAPQCASVTANTSYDGVATSLAAAAVSAVFYSGGSCDLSSFVAALSRLNFTAPLFASSASVGSPVAYGATMPVYQTSICTPPALLPRALFAVLATASTHRCVAETFDAVTMVLSSVAPTALTNHVQLLRALHALTFNGTSRVIRFTPTGLFEGSPTLSPYSAVVTKTVAGVSTEVTTRP
jgi:hypothetical protein